MKNHIPKISIIIVNHNGKKLLEDCLTSLMKSEYPQDKYEIIVVDNASSDTSVSYIAKNFPTIKVITLDTNCGFTGANNVGIDHANGEYIVLLNNDTIVDPDWIRQLVIAAKPERVGIVSSKLLLAVPYVKVLIESSVVQQSDIDTSTDFSPRGVLLENVYSENTTNAKIWYKSGFYDEEVMNDITSRWTSGSAEVLLPLTKDVNNFTFIFHGYPVNHKLDQNITLYLPNNTNRHSVISSHDVHTMTISINKKEVTENHIHLVQNAGNVIFSSGYSKDYGSVLRISNKKVEEFYEEDAGQYDTKKNLLAACGAAMLIKRKVIEQIGKLDGHYFMYYEDVEFSLRAWQMGWDIVFAPKAVVYHHHRASTGREESSFFISMTEKNHLLFVFTHFPLKICVQEYIYFCLRLVFAIIKQFISRFRNWDKYAFWRQRMVGRIEAFISFHKLIPTTIYKRFWWSRRYIRLVSNSKGLLY